MAAVSMAVVARPTLQIPLGRRRDSTLNALVARTAASTPRAEDFDWARDDFNAAGRTPKIFFNAACLRVGLAAVDWGWTYTGGATEEKKSLRRRQLAVWTRECCLSLGPTFIKLGQLFSSRADLLKPEFVSELALLQDRVPAFSAEAARTACIRGLGAPPEELFASWDPMPLAAASLGQVHRATLRSGELVVIKIQRPGLKRLFDVDLNALSSLAARLDAGEEARASDQDLVGIVAEAKEVLTAEIDYVAEGENCDRFRRNFRGEPRVQVPRVEWRYTTPTLLCLEWRPGIKISDGDTLRAAGLRPELVTQLATTFFLRQVLTHGFYHADPHPGNVAVDPITGALVFHDFGMMGTIPPLTRTRLLELLFSVVDKDAGRVLDTLVDLGVIKLSRNGDRLALRRSIQYFLDNLTRRLQQDDGIISAIGEDLFAIALDQPVRFPAKFTFLLRAFTTLEGIGKGLDPNYSFAQIAAPYAAELLGLRSAGGQRAFALDAVRDSATAFTTSAALVPERVGKIEATVMALESGDLRLRVRVLEAERAARRAGVLQIATLHAVAAASLVNMSVNLYTSGASGLGAAAMLVAAGFGVALGLSLRRVARLDKFERGLKN